MNVLHALFWSLLLMATFLAQIEPVYDADLTDGNVLVTSSPTLRVLDITGPEIQIRTVVRWPLAKIPSDATITKVEFIPRVVMADGDIEVDLHLLGLDGDEDAEHFDGVELTFNAMPSFGKYVENSAFMQSTGLKTVDLGATAVTHANLNLDNYDSFNLALICDIDQAPQQNATLAALESTTLPPAILQVTYTAPTQFVVPRGDRRRRYGLIGQASKRITRN